jgi:hypothetical protein
MLLAGYALSRSEDMRAGVIGIDRLIPYGVGQAEEWNVVISAAVIALAPRFSSSCRGSGGSSGA